MPGDPTTIGSAPENVIFTMIKHPLECAFGPEVVTRGRVANPFGFPRTSRCIENKKRCFAVEWLSRQIAALPIHGIMPPDVSTLGHRHVVLPDPLQHQALFDGRLLQQRFIHCLLEWQHLATPMQTVRSDDHFGASIIVSIGNGLRAESSKDH